MHTRTFGTFGTFLFLFTMFHASACAWASEVNSELIGAAGSGNLARVKALIAAGADVNVKTGDGVTPLIAASDSGYEDVVQALLVGKAAVNARTSNGGSAL